MTTLLLASVVGGVWHFVVLLGIISLMSLKYTLRHSEQFYRAATGPCSPPGEQPLSQLHAVCLNMSKGR